MASLTPRGAAPLLWTLAAWALVLSLVALVRQPGRADLPPHLLVGGRLYRPLPAPPPPGPLPEGLVLRAAADYVSNTGTNGAGHAAAGQLHLRLRRVALTQTGRSAVIPVERLGVLLVDGGVEGQCVELDPQGRVVRGWRSASAWRAARDARSATWPHRLTWLAGLRPYADNSCLWMSVPVDRADVAGLAGVSRPGRLVPAPPNPEVWVSKGLSETGAPASGLPPPLK